MPYPIPAEVLRHARDEGNLSQAALARRLGTVPSVLSKLERADDVESEIAERYLNAIESPVAREILEHYGRDWLRSTPPSYLHPDRDTLWIIDQAKRELETFEAETPDQILRGPIDLLARELNTVADYLDRRDHVIAWVGDIGVGKTTALTHAVGLLVGDGRSGKRPAFPVGPGRTTVCETAIRVAPTFGVVVDAVTDEEVIRLTRELVASLAPGATGGGVSAEMNRLIRNMADMKTVNQMIADEPVTRDPIADLLAEGVGVPEVADRVVGAMKLLDRKERQMLLPEGRDDGLLWASNLVSAINNGTEPRFGIPKRITVLMPSPHLSSGGQTLSVVDTRGIEGVTQRPDITAHADDPRTLLVLCTKFADAPNMSVQRHLQDSQEAGSDAAASPSSMHPRVAARRRSPGDAGTRRLRGHPATGIWSAAQGDRTGSGQRRTTEDTGLFLRRAQRRCRQDMDRSARSGGTHSCPIRRPRHRRRRRCEKSHPECR